MNKNPLLKKIRLITQFYRNHFILCLSLNLFCLKMLWDYGTRAWGGLTLLRLVVYGLICLYYFSYRQNGFYYYRNLGLVPLQLFAFSYLFDVLFFLLSALILMYSL